MEFISERTACTMISETVVKAGVSLFNAVKYIYMIADKTSTTSTSRISSR